jgi:hypothetical protein
MTPRPAALRLVTRATRRPPTPPFGLTVWTESATGIAVWLDAAAGVGDAAAVAAQIPEAGTLEAGAPVVVLGAAAGTGRALARWLGPRELQVAVALRCTALLARGYVRVGADAQLAWGWTPLT